MIRSVIKALVMAIQVNKNDKIICGNMAIAINTNIDIEDDNVNNNDDND